MEIGIIIGCIVVAAAISGIIMWVVKSKLKSVRAQRNACNYTRSGSFNVTNSREAFLYNNITRIPRAQNNSSGRRR